MGRQHCLAGLVANQIGDALVMRTRRRHALFAVFAAIDDFHHGERQDALGGFLQRAVEDLVHLVTKHVDRHRACGDPHRGQAQAKPQSETKLDGVRADHEAASR